MNWEMLGVICLIITVQGGLLVAASKSLFVTKKQIYDSNGLTIFVTLPEWIESKDGREQRRDASQRALCEKIEKMSASMDAVRATQNETNVAISNLLGRLETSLEKGK